MASPAGRLLRTLLGRPAHLDPQAHRQQNASHPSALARVLSRVAAIVFPTNSSGNNRSVR